MLHSTVVWQTSAQALERAVAELHIPEAGVTVTLCYRHRCYRPSPLLSVWAERPSIRLAVSKRDNNDAQSDHRCTPDDEECQRCAHPSLRHDGQVSVHPSEQWCMSLCCTSFLRIHHLRTVSFCH